MVACSAAGAATRGHRAPVNSGTCAAAGPGHSPALREPARHSRAVATNSARDRVFKSASHGCEQNQTKMYMFVVLVSDTVPCERIAALQGHALHRPEAQNAFTHHGHTKICECGCVKILESGRRNDAFRGEFLRQGPGGDL